MKTRSGMIRSGFVHTMGEVNVMDIQELPLGFSTALAQCPGALAHFGALSEVEQQALINRAHGADSEREMQELVRRMMT